MRQDSNALLLYCRPGFEGDCAAEVTEVAANLEEAGYCRAKPHSGFVVFQAVTPGAARRLWTEQRWRGLVFARQWLLIRAEITGLPTNDRAGPLAEAVVASGLTEISEVWLEFPDTNAGKELSRFCRKFTLPLTRALSDRGVGVRSDSTAPRLHVFFTDSASATLAVSAPGNSAPWPLGIPRLRMAKEAPSRSTLKLDEALRTFLTDAERQRLLAPGMTAVDLGAAPGGWSWQLARRGLQVTAVDNGPMNRDLLDDGLVEHVRADGFRYRPPKAVDWLVCDIVEQPHRIARLMADWLARGDCRAAVFNLKLPMKQRYPAVRDALELIGRRLHKADVAFDSGCKQLYHDREEVTVYVARRS